VKGTEAEYAHGEVSQLKRQAALFIDKIRLQVVNRYALRCPETQVAVNKCDERGTTKNNAEAAKN
jgi:hypothetical protein